MISFKERIALFLNMPKESSEDMLITRLGEIIDEYEYLNAILDENNDVVKWCENRGWKRDCTPKEFLEQLWESQWPSPDDNYVQKKPAKAFEELQNQIRELESKDLSIFKQLKNQVRELESYVEKIIDSQNDAWMARALDAERNLNDLKSREEQLKLIINSITSQQQEDRAAGRNAGITYNAVRDIFNAYDDEEISQGRAVELLRELVQGALNKITRGNQ